VFQLKEDQPFPLQDDLAHCPAEYLEMSCMSGSSCFRMIVSMNVSHFVKICQVLTILHQLICRGVTNFGTWCMLRRNGKQSRVCGVSGAKTKLTVGRICEKSSFKWGIKD